MDGKFFNNILIHEMIHLWQIQLNNDHGHGTLFKRKMNELNKKGFNISNKVAPFSAQFKSKRKLYLIVLKDKDDYYIVSLKEKPKQMDNMKISKILKDKEFVFEGYKELEILNNFTAHRSVKGAYKIKYKYVKEILDKT